MSLKWALKPGFWEGFLESESHELSSHVLCSLKDFDATGGFLHPGHQHRVAGSPPKADVLHESGAVDWKLCLLKHNLNSQSVWYQISNVNYVLFPLPSSKTNQTKGWWKWGRLKKAWNLLAVCDAFIPNLFYAFANLLSGGNVWCRLLGLVFY